MVASSSTRSTGSILTASVPRPLDEVEAAGFAVVHDLVLVGDDVDDGARELSQLGRRAVPCALTIDLDQAFGCEESKREGCAGAFVADQREGELVDRDAQIFEIADRQPRARAR